MAIVCFPERGPQEFVAVLLRKCKESSTRDEKTGITKKIIINMILSLKGIVYTYAAE